MTMGLVRNLQACVTVAFHLADGQHLEMEFVVDTGFEGALTLPPGTIERMGLPFYQEIDAGLADDSHVGVRVHKATIIWQEREYKVAVLAMGQRPLLGTALLAGHALLAEFVEDGRVLVREI